jgi:hypothetical protein
MTEPAITTVRVPGKVMLAGEYAVLGGGMALAVAIERYLTVQITGASSGDQGFTFCKVHSDLWAKPAVVAADTVAADYPDAPLLAAVAHAMQYYKMNAAQVDVTSELTVSYGIGSSSALRLGVMMAFSAAASRLKGDALSADDTWQCARQALRLQRQAQTHASGYDLATQLSGGLCQFKAGADIDHWPESSVRTDATTLAALSKLVQVYVGGAGAATTPLLNSTWSWLQANEQIPQLHAVSDDLHAAFAGALKAPGQAQAMTALAAACGRHRHLFRTGPAFPHELAADLEGLPGCDESWSFKTTGAGGEDAVLLIGSAAAQADAAHALAARGWTPLAANFTYEGAALDPWGAQ